MRKLSLSLLCLGTIVLVACQPVASRSTTGPTRARNLITAEEIDAANDANAYLLIERLHPQWLRKRGARSVSQGGDIWVYVDRTKMGPPSALRQIQLSDVRSIQFLTGPEADTHFGRGNEYGAIVVLSR